MKRLLPSLAAVTLTLALAHALVGGKALISASEAWGRSQGCLEFASDAHPDNDVSTSAHRAVGFADVGMVRCFRMEL